MTGAPDRYAAYAGTDVPVSQWASSTWPSKRYVASSRKAVLDQTRRKDKIAWIVRIQIRPSGARVNQLLRGRACAVAATSGAGCTGSTDWTGASEGGIRRAGVGSPFLPHGSL